MKERLHYIDVMKGITMLVVVLHHVLWITVDLKNVTNSTMLVLHGWQDMLASFIMPAFFFCTGYCSSFNKAFKPFFISNFKSLLLFHVLSSGWSAGPHAHSEDNRFRARCRTCSPCRSPTWALSP